MTRSEQLIKEVKSIFENIENTEVNETEVNEMARAAFNVEVTEAGSKAFKEAFKNMEADIKSGKYDHSTGFVYKVFKVFKSMKPGGKKVLTSDLRKATGCKHTAPMNELLRGLQKEGYITRESSHVPQPKVSKGPKGRPKGSGEPKQEKEKINKMGGLKINKKPESTLGQTYPQSNFNSPNYAADGVEENMLNENKDLLQFSKDIVNKYGANGDQGPDDGDDTLEEMELGGAATNATEDTRDNQSAIHPVNESNNQLALMQYRAGLITDTEYRKKIGLDKIV